MNFLNWLHWPWNIYDVDDILRSFHKLIVRLENAKKHHDAKYDYHNACAFEEAALAEENKLKAAKARQVQENLRKLVS